jgi:hypothetical protein
LAADVRTLQARLGRLDGGDLRNRAVEHMTDTQLIALMLGELRQTNPALAARYASATNSELGAILETIANGGDL